MIIPHSCLFPVVAHFFFPVVLLTSNEVAVERPNLSFLPPPDAAREHVVQSTTKSSSTVNYLPRLLYPGTYGEYCGPTPEIDLLQDKSCAAHGWHGDQPKDIVDEACRIHDVSYCKCETEWLSRITTTPSSSSGDLKIKPSQLSSLMALRFLVTQSTLEKALPELDQEFFHCINKADRQLIATGVRVRSEMQRSSCSIDPTLSWFCDTTTPTPTAARNNNKGVTTTTTTLNAFEKINLAIFLRDLDADADTAATTTRTTTTTTTTTNRIDGHHDVSSLQALERQRQVDLQEQLKQGKTLADAVSSASVQEDEYRIVKQLQQQTQQDLQLDDTN